MDSWFGLPKTIRTLSTHVPVICILKNMYRVFYKYQGMKLTLDALQRILTLAIHKLRKTSELSEQIVQEMLDALMDAVKELFNLKSSFTQVTICC